MGDAGGLDGIVPREELQSRSLPQMTLSQGNKSDSLTQASQPLATTLMPDQKALARFSVTGNVVLTGGAGNLALEAARALLEHGATGLAVTDLDTQSVARQIEALKKDFPKAKIIARDLDVTDEEGVEKTFAEIAEQLGGTIDVLACFAGITALTHALDITAPDFRRMMDINTAGMFICAQAAAKIMTKQSPPRGGNIVFIASISGHRVNFPQPQVSYNTSKAAVLHMAHSLAAEWAQYGIRVNTLSPGYMDTILNTGDGLECGRKIWAERNPMGRMGATVELTGPLIMLTSKYAGAYVTGADIVVDGGGIVF